MSFLTSDTMRIYAEAITAGAIAQLKALAGAETQVGTAAAAANTKMSTGSAASAVSLASLGTRMTTVAAQAITFGKSCQWIGRQLEFSLTLPIVGAAVATVLFARDFGEAMAKAAAAAQVTANRTSAGYRLMEDSALRVGKTTIFSAKEAADGLYELVSAGYSAAGASRALEGAALFAQAAQLKLGVSTEFLSKMLKVYAVQGYSAANITDIVSYTVQKSQAHFTDFTHNISMAIGAWSSAGQSLEELAGAAGLLADRGAPAARTGFWLRGAIDALIKPSGPAAKAIAEIGLQTYDATGKMLPFSNILGQVREKTKDLTNAERDRIVTTIWGTRAGSAMRLLLGATTEQLEKYTDMANKAKGTTQSMADVIAKSPWGRWQIALNKAKTVLAEFGLKLLPIVTTALEKVVNLLDSFNNMDAGTQRIIVLGLAFLAALGPIVRFIGIFSQLYGILSGVGGAIFKVVGWFATLVKNSVYLVGSIKSVGDATAAAQLIFGGWITMLPAVGLALLGLIGFLAEFGSSFGDFYEKAGGVAGIWDGIKTAFSDGCEFVKAEMKKIEDVPNVTKKVEIVIGDIDKAWSDFSKKNATYIEDTMRDYGVLIGRFFAGGILTGLLNVITGLIPDVINRESGKGETAAGQGGANIGWALGSGILEGLWKGTGNVLKAIWHLLTKVSENILVWIADMFGVWDYFGEGSRDRILRWLEWMPKAKKDLGDVGSAAKDAKDPIEDLTEDFAALANTANMMDIPFQNMKDAMTGVETAQTNVNTALSNYLLACQQSGSTITPEATTALQAYREAVAAAGVTQETLTSTIFGNIRSMQDAGISTESLRGMLGTLQAQGLLTEDQVKLLTDAINNVPTSHTTVMTVNSDQAWAEIVALENAFANSWQGSIDWGTGEAGAPNRPRSMGGWVNKTEFALLGEKGREFVLSNPMLKNLQKGIMPAELMSYLGSQQQKPSTTLAPPITGRSVIEIHSHTYLDGKQVAESVNYHNSGISTNL